MSNEETTKETTKETTEEKSFWITVSGDIEVFGDETVEEAIAWVEQNLDEVELEVTGEENK